MLIIQLTGLSGSGKTTLSYQVKRFLKLQNLKIEIIDGDEYRQGLCKDLGFSREDRCENIRRLGRAASELAVNAHVVIIAAINPFHHVRQELVQLYGAKIVWLQCPLDELIQRDTKGLYKRALLPDNHPDKLHSFTGISDCYDIPVDFDLEINTGIEPITHSTERLGKFIIAQLVN